MFMTINFKLIAREKLQSNGLKSAFLSFLALLVMAPLYFALMNSGNLWLYLAVLLISGPLILALNRYFLLLCQKQPAALSDFFGSFCRASQGALALLWQWLWISLWSLLFLAPGIVKGAAYSMQLRLLCEYPHLSAKKSLQLSQKMTYGYRWELLMTALSFGGWLILSVMTFGLALLFVLPYWQLTWGEIYYFLLNEALKNGRITADELGIVSSKTVISGDEWLNELPLTEEKLLSSTEENAEELSFDADFYRQTVIIAQAALLQDASLGKECEKS